MKWILLAPLAIFPTLLSEIHSSASGKFPYRVDSTYLAASPYSRSSSSPTATATARCPRIVPFSIYVAVNVLNLLTRF